MPALKPTRGRSGRPPVTSREQILAAARQLIERDGWEKLTIRRLAAEVGVGATTLYHHVRDREDLLIQLLNWHTEQTFPDELPSGPRERIIAAMTAIHDGLTAWPWAAEVLTVDGFLGRLGEQPLRMVEAVVSGAVDHGCTLRQAVEVFRHLWYYTVGEILVRARSRRSGRPDPPGGRDSFFVDGIDPSRFPQLAAIGNQWPTFAARDSYREGLVAFIDGLLAQATTSRAGPAGEQPTQSRED